MGTWYEGAWYDYEISGKGHSDFTAGSAREALRKAIKAAKPGETILVRDEYFVGRSL